MNKIKKRVLIIFGIILMILSTLLACNVLAQNLTDTGRGEMIIKSTDGTGSLASNPLTALNTYWDVLCCERGKALNDACTYSLRGEYFATPEEAYILAELVVSNAKDGTGHNTVAQNAWWNTEAGSEGSSGANNELSQTAKAFEKYIEKIINPDGTIDPSGWEHSAWPLTTVTFEDINRDYETVTIENAFDIIYEPKWVTEGDCEKPTVMFDQDTDKYLIGPFAIDYVNDEFNDVQFAGILAMELYTDDSDEPLKLGEDWNIIYKETVSAKEPGELPDPNEEFYIELNYRENATQVTNIRTFFRYMNAAGSYDKYDGKLVEVKKEPIYDLHGNIIGEQTTYGENPSQTLTIAQYGYRWYQYAKLDRSISMKSKSIQIVKEVVNSDGEKIDTDKFFDFKITVEGAINSGSEKVRVRAGSSVTSQVYYWAEIDENGDETAAPTYTVEEIPTEGFELIAIENATGNLGQKEGVIVKAINKITDENKGKLQIVKKIKDTTLKTDQYDLVGKIFKFKVTVSSGSQFKYGGKLFDGENVVLYPEVTAVKESEEGIPWTSEDFTWYGDEAPKFVVEEILEDDGGYKIPEHAKLLSITPDSGTLVKDETTKVVAINTYDGVNDEYDWASIHIIKKLENADYLSEEKIKSLVFKFKIHVDGYEDISVTTTPSRIENEDGSYTWVWEYTTGKYVWIPGNAPKYSITEFDNPEGTILTGGASDSGETTLEGYTLKGTLVADKTKNCVVTNTLVNKYEGGPKTGKITLEKEVDTDVLVDRDYLFVVTVTGNFIIEGEDQEKAKETRTVQFLNNKDGITYVELKNGEYEPTSFVKIHVDSSKKGSWASPIITWYSDEAPTYKVEENLSGSNGEGIGAASVNPSQGSLDEKADVKVVAKNIGNQDLYDFGRIHVIKTLENAEKYDAEYINSLVFKFKVSVDGYEPIEVELKAERVDDKFVWEYLSDEFVWKKELTVDGKGPHYTIEEIELPEGTKFVKAEGPEGSTPGDKSVSGNLIPGKNDDTLITTDNKFVNALVEDKESYITIKKDVTTPDLKGKEFKFKLTLKGTFKYGDEEIVNGEKVIEDITVKGGETWKSSTIKWYGNDAPQYTIEEIESEIGKPVTIINGAGTVKEGENGTIATFVNEPKYKTGYLKIHKVLKDQPVKENDEFTFRITIGDNEPYTISIKADETYTSPVYRWLEDSDAPKYKVEEVGFDEGTCELSNAEGTLSDGAEVTVEAVNQYTEHKGRFILKKVVIEDKTVPAEAATFNFKVTVTGQFTLDGSTISEIWTQDVSVQGGGTYESPEFTWYGDDIPVVHVEEITDNLGPGWTFMGISNNDSGLNDGSIEIVATNKYDPLAVIDLTMQLAGTVWNDVRQTDDKNMEGSKPNGKLDEGEIGIDGVEVYVYDDQGNLATIYEDASKNLVQQPIITANGGKWNAPRVKILKDGSYDVKFVYDGQTYEPTTPLVTGTAESYRAASNSKRADWFNDSMADDINREEVNGRLAEIKGDTPIDGAGNTVGMAVPGLGEGKSQILYERKSGENENRTISKVVTLNSNGRVKDLYKAEATTSKVGLTYPFDKKLHLESFDIEPSELGATYRYVYSATYPYCLHVNMGLVNREIADLDAIKDLVDAKVVVNERLLTYKFNKLADVGKDVLTRTSYLDGTDGNSNIQYQIGFYQTDYYYRAEIYKADKVYDYMQEFYKSIGQTLNDTNLEVYLRYKLSVYNESPSYVVEINELNDYFDSSFGAPITTEVKKYVQTIDGKETDSSDLVTVAYPSTVVSTGANVDWQVKEKNILGSDGISYNKMSTSSLKGMKLASGEKAEIYVYFKVEPTSVEGINDTIELGTKSNIVEISNYSTYNTDGSIAGKIDVDSAPDNINIRNYNSKKFYEDDTDSAPILNLTLDLEKGIRTLSGLAWEDKAEESTDNTAIGNGVYDEGKEALIGGLTTELIEKIKIKTGDSYQEYEFLWPTNEPLSFLGGYTVEKLTGFDSITETGRNVAADDNSVGVGEYKFKGIPVGNYFVRFLYGNNKAELEDTFGITSDPVALKADGTKFAEGEENKNILIANYNEDVHGTTAAVYNGQDFKATLYQKNSGEAVTEWHNLKAYETYNSDSDFIDSEARRLDILAKSQVITNVNGTLLATANSYGTIEGNDPNNYLQTTNHAKLYSEYYMFADTGKVNFNIEKIEITDENRAVKNYELETTETDFGNGTVKIITNQRTSATEINDIDIGLIKRPENKITLDKQISNIKLTTNDHKVIFDAQYDIEYKVVGSKPKDKTIIADLGDRLIGHKYLVAEVKLSKERSIAYDMMQALDKVENKITNDPEYGSGIQNFRFINVDETILQGTTIELGYKLTALNIGQKDTISSRVANISTEEMFDDVGNLLTTKQKIKVLADELEEEAKKFSPDPQAVKTLELGKYVGKEYYTGTPADTDEVVTVRVRQLVDYIDTDGTFTADFNKTENHSWQNTSVNELLGNGYEANRIVDLPVAAEHELVDKDNVQYITSQRNNIALSVDNYQVIENMENAGVETTTLNNSGFQQKLLPLIESKMDDDSYVYKSEIALTVTKTVSATEDADNLTYDNIAEIVKYENVAGRRDEATIPGNVNPGKQEFEESLDERDQSATELVTFTPPTGLEVESGMTLQILLITVVSLAIVAVGVVIIKKKVL